MSFVNYIAPKQHHFYLFSISIIIISLIISAINPYDRLTWWLEVSPVIILLPILMLTANKFPLSNLLYILIALHVIVLVTGGHYTYERAPLGYWLKDWLHLARNDFDRIGHFMQGFVPAIALRELLLRTSPLGRSKWLPLLIVASCLGISAAYEIVEWLAALALGQNANQFLATQGDIWDTQWDMFTALIGALMALIFLAKWHDRSLIKCFRINQSEKNKY